MNTENENINIDTSQEENADEMTAESIDEILPEEPVGASDDASETVTEESSAENSEEQAEEAGYENTQQEPAEKSRGSFYTVFVIIFILLTAGLGIFSLFSPDRDFSEAENRTLSKMPTFSIETLLDGSFMGKLEDYMADQFPLRDEAIALKTSFDRTVGKREENGVYIGKKGFLFDSPVELNREDIKIKTDLINKFAAKYKNTSQLLTIIPDSGYFYEEYLPYGLNLPDREKQTDIIYSSVSGSNIATVDTAETLEALKERGTQLFYKTDHHWTTEAAYGVFKKISERWSLSSDVSYKFYTVTDSFEGTLSSKAGIHGIKDTISVCLPEGEKESYIVNYESLGKKTASLFFEDKLEQKNCYEVFLGGNYDKVSVETTAINDNTLLIVKDSYANCMIPMFTPHFSQIVVVDPRYMAENIETIMSEYSFTHVLFLYSLNTFLQDSTMIDVFSLTK